MDRLVYSFPNTAVSEAHGAPALLLQREADLADALAVDVAVTLACDTKHDRTTSLLPKPYPCLHAAHAGHTYVFHVIAILCTSDSDLCCHVHIVKAGKDLGGERVSGNSAWPDHRLIYGA